MSALLNGLSEATNKAFTDNGAISRETTNSDCLDFFSHGGALRNAPERAVHLFDKAYNEDKDVALKTMFYFRDIRGGQGQRKAFRDQMKYLATIDAQVMEGLIKHVAEFGRWDDLYSLFDTDLKKSALQAFNTQMILDMKAFKVGEQVSLLAKWLKSENASSKLTKTLARDTRKHFKWSSKHYRKVLSALRKYINVTECQVSARQWKDINYSAVPSNAMMKYRKAFKKHDEKRFETFIEKVNSGEAKINSSVLYPYEIVEKILEWSKNIEPSVAQAMWQNLPNYVDPEVAENAIAVVDTSGSMSGQPMNVAVSLGIYLAERASGSYKDHFITFSAEPKLQKLKGEDITEKVKNLSRANWDMNTNLEKVFMLILNVAKRDELSQDDMLDKIYIISDMQFDSCMGGGRSWGARHDIAHCTLDKTLMVTLQNRFKADGYVMPELVFWNVNATNSSFPMSLDDRGFLNVSGFSPSIFKSLIGGEYTSPTQLMLDVVNAERYDVIHS